MHGWSRSHAVRALPEGAGRSVSRFWCPGPICPRASAAVCGDRGSRWSSPAWCRHVPASLVLTAASRRTWCLLSSRSGNLRKVGECGFVSPAAPLSARSSRRMLSSALSICGTARAPASFSPSGALPSYLTGVEFREWVAPCAGGSLPCDPVTALLGPHEVLRARQSAKGVPPPDGSLVHNTARYWASPPDQQFRCLASETALPVVTHQVYKYS